MHMPLQPSGIHLASPAPLAAAANPARLHREDLCLQKKCFSGTRCHSPEAVLPTAAGPVPAVRPSWCWALCPFLCHLWGQPLCQGLLLLGLPQGLPLPAQRLLLRPPST